MSSKIYTDTHRKIKLMMDSMLFGRHSRKYYRYNLDIIIETSGIIIELRFVLLSYIKIYKLFLWYNINLCIAV